MNNFKDILFGLFFIEIIFVIVISTLSLSKKYCLIIFTALSTSTIVYLVPSFVFTVSFLSFGSSKNSFFAKTSCVNDHT